MILNAINICLIDDDRIYQFAAKKTLEATSLVKNITVFSNGEEAIQFLNTTINDECNFPDVIFLDINMPVMNGWEFLDAFNLLKVFMKKTVSIYVVSSSVSDYDIAKSKEYNAVSGYVIKPVSKEKFMQLLAPFCRV